MSPELPIESRKCIECHADTPTELTTCNYCGRTLCYDCRDQHERTCEDNDDKEDS
jgi:hypothetical protein